MARAKKVKGIDCSGDARDNARRIIAVRLEEMLSFGKYVNDPARVKKIHNLRIAAKRLRYTLEMFQFAFPEGLDDLISEVKQIQEHIGDMRDADLMIARIDRILAHNREERAARLREIATATRRGTVAQRQQRIRSSIKSSSAGRDETALYGLIAHYAGKRDRAYEQFALLWGRMEATDFSGRLRSHLDAENVLENESTATRTVSPQQRSGHDEGQEAVNDTVRVAVFSDVHGNLQGLSAVVDAIRKAGTFDRIIAAGDFCLNGPEPAEALDFAVEVATDLMYGNTDRDIVDRGAQDNDLDQQKADMIGWTRDQLGSERIERLSRLQFSVSVEAGDGSRLLVVHANPQDVDRHIRPDASDDDVAELVGDTQAAVLAFGHLHIPYVREFRGMTLADIASAGLPRDGDRRATWGEFVWTPESGWSVTIHRVEYDYQLTVQRMFDLGLPNAEAQSKILLNAVYD